MSVRTALAAGYEGILADLVGIEEYEALLTDTCTIRRYTSSGTKDRYGHEEKTWSNLATSVECRFEPTSGREIVSDKEIVDADYMLYLKTGQDITEKDRIVNSGSETFEILLFKKFPALSSTVHHIEVAIKLMRT